MHPAKCPLIIATIRATYLCLQGSRVLTSRMLSNSRPEWEDKAGLSLFYRYCSRQQHVHAYLILLVPYFVALHLEIPHSFTGPQILILEPGADCFSTKYFHDLDLLI
jgi:hypothetical protein